MTSVLEALRSHPISQSALLFTASMGTNSLKHAIWKWKLARINGLFANDTDEAEEDNALALILSAESADELLFLIRGSATGVPNVSRTVGWPALDYELDQLDLNEICNLLNELLDRRDYIVDHVLGRFFNDTGSLADIQINQATAVMTTLVSSFSTSTARALVDELLQKRLEILEGIEKIVLRDKSTHIIVFRALIDNVLIPITNYQAPLLTQLSWETHYEELIGSQLESIEYVLLLTTLPELVDATLPQIRRQALFDILRRWDAAFQAMEDTVDAVGDVRQKADMRAFMRAKRVFQQNFPQATPAPGVIAQLLQTLGIIGNNIADLRMGMLDLSQSINEALTFAKLFGTIEDDEARQAASALSTQNTGVGDETRLSVLPFSVKFQLINRMLDGATLDEDERGILLTLSHTKRRSVAEFAQLVAAAGWEELDESLDGDEHDELMKLFEF